jgi:hypothetical protein
MTMPEESNSKLVFSIEPNDPGDPNTQEIQQLQGFSAAQLLAEVRRRMAKYPENTVSGAIRINMSA